jgi:putative iron-regulated protein
MKKIFITAAALTTLFAACKKDDTTTTPAEDFTTLKSKGITDFVNVVAMPGYAELKSKAATLNSAVTTLNTTATDANLTAARNAWKDLRTTWEKCEGFLFGPIEDDEVDPDTDTWPVNFNDFDALLSGTTDLSNVETFDRSLKGFHPLEYILWGEDGNRTAASLTARQKIYMIALSTHLTNKMGSVYDAWVSTGGNYANKFLTAGAGSTLYAKKQDAYIALLEGFLGICSEVADGKMKEPYDAQQAAPGSGAQLVESPYSGNSVTDFKNNIIGAYNVYLGKFNDQGKGLTDLVKAKNVALDNSIKAKFDAAIGSFNNITLPYEDAIVSQRLQCQATMDAISALADLLNADLRAFIITNITD